MTSDEIIDIKNNYFMRMKTRGSKLVFLNEYEVQRKDFWSQKIFGTPNYTFMFDILIYDIKKAKVEGYYIAKS